jgi:hypothetical protein
MQDDFFAQISQKHQIDQRIDNQQNMREDIGKRPDIIEIRQSASHAIQNGHDIHRTPAYNLQNDQGQGQVQFIV